MRPRYLLIASLIILGGIVSITLTPKEVFSPSVPAGTKKLKISPETQRGEDPNLLRSPSLDEIFDDQIKDLSSLAKEKLATLIATGDVIPARTVNYKMTKYNNFKYPFEKTADILATADITLINLESPLIESCPLTNEGMVFCGDQRFVEGLLFAGVDVVNLANNHLGNRGPAGINQTIKLLHDNQIQTTGHRKIHYKRVGETNFAFLGYNGVAPKVADLSWIDREIIAEEIKKAKESADIVIVSFHWGQEYTEVPRSDRAVSPFDPVEIAHFTIDSGADLIIGNHPHWVQGIEIYKGKLTTYAQGNFIFDQMWSQKTREGVIGRYTFYDKKLIEVEFVPVIINDYAQPQPLEGEAKQAIIDRMKSNSLSRYNPK